MWAILAQVPPPVLELLLFGTEVGWKRACSHGVVWGLGCPQKLFAAARCSRTFQCAGRDMVRPDVQPWRSWQQYRLQDILDFFLLAQEDFCLAWPLWSPHFLVFALALDMAFLVLPWPLLVWPLPFMAAGWVLAAGFLAALGFGLLELVLEPAHGAWSHPAEGNPSMGNHTAGHPTLRMNTQLPHGLCGFFAVDLDIPHRTGVDRVAACREEMAP